MACLGGFAGVGVVEGVVRVGGSHGREVAHGGVCDSEGSGRFHDVRKGTTLVSKLGIPFKGYGSSRHFTVNDDANERIVFPGERSCIRGKLQGHDVDPMYGTGNTVWPGSIVLLKYIEQYV